MCIAALFIVTKTWLKPCPNNAKVVGSISGQRYISPLQFCLEPHFLGNLIHLISLKDPLYAEKF